MADDPLDGVTEASDLPSANASASGASTATVHDVRKSFSQALMDMQPMVKDFLGGDNAFETEEKVEKVDANEADLKKKLKELKAAKASRKKEDREAKAAAKAEAAAERLREGGKPPKEKSFEASFVVKHSVRRRAGEAEAGDSKGHPVVWALFQITSFPNTCNSPLG